MSEQKKLEAGQKVRLTKVTGKNQDAQADGYTCSGVLALTPALGHRIVIDREERNGVAVPGLFTSSPVKMITYEGNGGFLHSLNSVWSFRWLDD